MARSWHGIKDSYAGRVEAGWIGLTAPERSIELIAAQKQSEMAVLETLKGRKNMPF